jgi:hypothetical protein
MSGTRVDLGRPAPSVLASGNVSAHWCTQACNLVRRSVGAAALLDVVVSARHRLS